MCVVAPRAHENLRTETAILNTDQQRIHYSHVVISLTEIPFEHSREISSKDANHAVEQLRVEAIAQTGETDLQRKARVADRGEYVECTFERSLKRELIDMYARCKSSERCFALRGTAVADHDECGIWSAEGALDAGLDRDRGASQTLETGNRTG